MCCLTAYVCWPCPRRQGQQTHVTVFPDLRNDCGRSNLIFTDKNNGQNYRELSFTHKNTFFVLIPLLQYFNSRLKQSCTLFTYVSAQQHFLHYELTPSCHCTKQNIQACTCVLKLILVILWIIHYNIDPYICIGKSPRHVGWS